MTRPTSTNRPPPSPAPPLLGASLRLLVDRPADGLTNMAIDEAMLAAVGAGEAPPTLRLYRWRPATLSLGYFQSFADLAEQSAQVRAMPIVRRTTGGGAILHADELTYSLVLPAANGRAGAGGAELYTLMHGVIAVAAETLAPAAAPVSECGAQAADEPSAGGRGGPFFCFARRSRHDLLAGHDKLVGSAQRRTREAVLQHGSVILSRSYADQPSASLAEITGRDVTFKQAAMAFIAAVADAGVELDPGHLTPAEQQAIEPLRAKHASDEWLKRR